MIGRLKDLPRIRPITANKAPNESEPASPRNMRAGGILKYRNAINPPSQIPINKDVGTSMIEAAMIQKLAREIMRIPVARPSSPSVILTALEKATIVKAANAI